MIDILAIGISVILILFVLALTSTIAIVVGIILTERFVDWFEDWVYKTF